MEKILALDLGTNSIGWAIRNTAKINENQIEKFGVLTFKKGVGIDKTGEYSYAAQRTTKRSTRRLYQARKYRLWKTLEVLIKLGYCPLSEENLDKWRKYNKQEALKNKNAGRVYPVNDILFESWIKLDFNNDGKPDYTSPYQLRKELCEDKIDFENIENKHKLGRALYHIAQRRGFKSSRKGADDIKEKESNDILEVELQYSEQKKKKELKKQFPDYDETKPICYLLADQENKGNRVRLDITQFLVREDYKNEIKAIFKKQNISFESELYKDIIESGNNKNDGAIFYKRPLRSQKGLIGKCTLEQNKYRAPISHPSFEYFRAWSFLNNVKYKTNEEWYSLPLELKQNIYDKLFFRKSKAHFHFSEIIDFANKEIKADKYNYNFKTTVSGCPVSARLKEIFGEDFTNLKIKKEKTDKSNNDSYTIEDIWHILFSFEDQEYVEEFAKNKLKLNDIKIKEFVKAWNVTPVGYAMLSLNAINKINPFLAKGLIYTEAVLLANIPTIIGKELWEKNEKFLLDEISNIIENNRFQKRIVSIVNDLISKHKNLEPHEKFGGNDYSLVNSDFKDIETACNESFGEKTWEKLESEKKQLISNIVKDCYQGYFKVIGFERKDFNDERFRIVETNSIKFYKADSDFYRMPKLKDTLAEFLTNNFNITEKQIQKIYHPSEINIYPPAKEDKKDGIIKLGTPKTGSFKNPMAMRTLHELRKLMNNFIVTNEIVPETRIVVEVARELNDSNKRWAIETWQKRREEENKEFALVINELLNQNNNLKIKDNNEDIDKVRLWYEQNEKDLEVIPPLVESKKEIKGLDWRSAKKDSYKEIIAQKSQVEKYRLWLEQECMCIYTGKIIKLTDLFDENITDFEHTIPRSKSFDNSLANLTVCFSDYNRNIKKNQIPYNLDNYSTTATIKGKQYTAILPRLEKWIEKIKRIEQQIEFWKGKSKRANTKEAKDDAIRQRHLWQMDYEYWKNKVERFTMKEITSGFKNSQKVDTQLISKYAFHYLKTYFNKVDVQKGSITAEFRKIYGLQIADEKKDRSKHSHHAKDAAVLSLIPIAAKRDEILQKYYEHKERFENYTDSPYKGFRREHITEIDNTILINNIAKNQTLTPANKKVRRRGKEVIIEGTNKTKLATGDCIRGQLHDETFFGAIKLGIKDETGKLLKDENGKFIQDEKVNYVLRVPLKFKKNENDSGFKTIDEIKKVIVDKDLFHQIEKQATENGGLREALEKGIYMFNKKGEKVNKIRRIRIYKDVTEPLQIKKHTYLSTHKHKQHYYASNSSNILYGLYKGFVKGKEKVSYEIINLFDVAKLKSFSSNKNEFFPDKGEDIKLYAILEVGQKVIFYKNNIQEIPELSKRILSDRLYKVEGFEKDGRIRFKHHMDALSDKELKELEKKYGKGIHQGFSLLNDEFPWPKLKLSMGNLKMAIENLDFRVNINGEIEWI